jgi:preprotein translocase subunit SecE
VAEWSIAAVLKTAKAKHLRGFESLPLRHIGNVKKYILGLLIAFVAFAVIAAPGDAPQTPPPAGDVSQTAAAATAAPDSAATPVPTSAVATTTRTEAGATTVPAPAASTAKKSQWLGPLIWAVVIGGAFVFLWSKGYLVRIRNYFAETQEELKKCSWPSRDELKGSTVVVLVTTILLGLFTVVVDWALSNLMRLIT